MRRPTTWTRCCRTYRGRQRIGHRLRVPDVDDGVGRRIAIERHERVAGRARATRECGAQEAAAAGNENAHAQYLITPSRRNHPHVEKIDMKM